MKGLRPSVGRFYVAPSRGSSLAEVSLTLYNGAVDIGNYRVGVRNTPLGLGNDGVGRNVLTSARSGSACTSR
jgi:hypothetical protein